MNCRSKVVSSNVAIETTVKSSGYSGLEELYRSTVVLERGRHDLNQFRQYVL